ncbi:MAG: RibD family protein [Pseudomonadales bacterium]|nr:RibD family protein [Pseudomonadales bacterium]
MDLNQRIGQWLQSTQQEFYAENNGAGPGDRPQVTLSFAQSWDGSITTSPGETLVLSSEAGMQMTHQLRSLHDGILVGIGTILADDPRLTVREWTGSNPKPIVLDSQLRMPPSSWLCKNADQLCWVLTTQQAAGERDDCELIVVPGDEAGKVDLPSALQELHARGIRSLMVEGGASIITAFLRAGLADAIVLTVAPMLLGGYNAIGRLCEAGGVQKLPRISPLHSQQLGDELFVWGRLHYGEVER